ncbi:MAG: FAD-dependent oxidoreductase, partial [Spirillospora sp.]
MTLVASGELGARLSAGARGHLRRACGRLDVTVLASDATVWTAGFAVDPLAAAAGLEVTGDGRIVVDRTMRSVSHPDVYAAGDCAYAIGGNGRPLPMSCASAGHTGRQAVEAIVGRLTGREIANTRLVYVYNHISLGRRDGILQPVDGDARARPRHLRGRTAARVKAGILRMSLWTTLHPTFGLPRRR